MNIELEKQSESMSIYISPPDHYQPTSSETGIWVIEHSAYNQFKKYYLTKYELL